MLKARTVAAAEPNKPARANGLERFIKMKSTTNETDLQTLMGAGLSNEYSYQEQEAELLAASAEDDADAWQGYSEFSADLEEAAWIGAQTFNGVTIKKACEHTSCDHFRCEKSLRIGGIEI